MPALPGRKVPSFHDTDMEILLLLYFGVLTIALVALFAVITMRENRGQLFLRDPGGRQGDRPLLCQATPVLPQGGISCSRKGQEGKRKKKMRIWLDNPEPRSSSQMVVLDDNVVQSSKTQVSHYGGWAKATLTLQRTFQQRHVSLQLFQLQHSSHALPASPHLSVPTLALSHQQERKMELSGSSPSLQNISQQNR